MSLRRTSRASEGPSPCSKSQHRQVGLRLDEALTELADGQSQGHAHQHPVRAAVADREDGLLGRRRRAVAVDVIVEELRQEGTHAGRDFVAGLAARVRQDVGRLLPMPAGRRVVDREVLVRQAFPLAVVHLHQAGIAMDGRPASDDPGRLRGAAEGARDDPVPADAPEPIGQRLRLRPACRVEGSVDPLPEVLLRDRAIGQAVAGEDEGEHPPASVGGGSRTTTPARGTMGEPRGHPQGRSR